MNTAIDRMWNIRDAVLLWMYTEKANGRGEHMNVDASDVASAVDWMANPISAEEINSATKYLFEKRLVTGQYRSNGQLTHAHLTAEGEDWAERGTTIRPGRHEPANTSGVVYHNTINNHGSANIAVQANDFTQNLTVGESAEAAIRVATALEAAAQEADSEAAAEATQIASDLRQAAVEPESNKGLIKSLLLMAAGAGVTSLGTGAGNQVLQLALGAVPVFS